MKKELVYIFLLLIHALAGYAQKNVFVENNDLKLSWSETSEGWKLAIVELKSGKLKKSLNQLSGENTLLYSKTIPEKNPDQVFKLSTGFAFPDSMYQGWKGKWNAITNAVSLNTAGDEFFFYPKFAKPGDKEITFSNTTSVAVITQSWVLDPLYAGDILVKQTIKAKTDGYFSLASTSLLTLAENDLSWATIPGYFQGNRINKDFVTAYGYGHGIPELPVIYRERAAGTLTSIQTSKNGFTIAVTPDPSIGRDPWENSSITQTNWNVGLSHKNRRADLTPTLYYPILGEAKSFLKAGDEITFSFRYSINRADWFSNLKHVIYDVYKFKQSLGLRENKQSLTSRIDKLYQYITNNKTSLWKVAGYEGHKIGAQEYMGFVKGSDKDAMKNSDYAAMWMLGKLTSDKAITVNRLPFARNFKLAQQDTASQNFSGSVKGQYFLSKKEKFVEEWGEISEPVAITYYAIADMANILLFSPNDSHLKSRIKLAADRLMNWQKADGSWAVAYDHHSGKEIYEDLKDYRPTFYGLLIAYNVLKDKKYLAAAEKGAEWLLKNSVSQGSFLGVCGDTRYAPDFATGQIAQAFLTLFDITKKPAYRNAAIEVAKMYVSSIYTHPVATEKPKLVGGKSLKEWEISQTGLSFEHGGVLGSANGNGPILLSSHTGLFLRIYELTGDEIFADMARAAAIGRDAFLNSETSVSSYYWKLMDAGAGQYPQHAWWQIGWIYDYLISEVRLRSNGRINFPATYFTPKVGPHKSYGFSPGIVFNKNAELFISRKLLSIDNPQIEYITAAEKTGDKTYVIVLNDVSRNSIFNIEWLSESTSFKKLSVIDAKGQPVKKYQLGKTTNLAIASYGLLILELS